MKEDRKIKNVVLIMLDTLQFNYLGCYGNKVVKTPNIDRLARQGFLFENAYSEGLPTVPVRRALMTGRFTLPYGGWQPLAPDDTTVADIMWGKNMQTALVYDTPPMRLPKYGYSRGFDFVSFNPGQELDHTSFADVPLEPAGARAVDAHRGPHHGTRMRAHPRPVHGKDHAGGQVGGRTARLHPCSGALG